MHTPGFNLYRQSAALIFRVKPADVTPAMVAQARDSMRALLYARALIPPAPPFHVGVNMDATRRRTYNFWPKCPECRQDATGMYAGQPGCCRCGWPTPRRKANF